MAIQHRRHSSDLACEVTVHGLIPHIFGVSVLARRIQWRLYQVPCTALCRCETGVTM